MRRGFFPRGGGVVSCSVPALAPGQALPAFDLTQRGEVGMHMHACMRSAWAPGWGAAFAHLSGALPGRIAIKGL